MNYLCRLNQLELNKGLPVITDESLEKTKPKSRVYFKDQWASHPSLAEREANIHQFPIHVESTDLSPWLLFPDKEVLQEKMTDKLYALDAESVATYSILSHESYAEKLIENDKQNTLPEIFNGFYNHRSIEKISLDTIFSKTEEAPDFQYIYSEDNKNKIELYQNNHTDLELLQDIKSGHIQARIFEFETVKYTKKDAQKLIWQLKKELEEQKEWLRDLDEKAVYLNYLMAKNNQQEARFCSLYTNYQELEEDLSAFLLVFQKIQAFYSKITQYLTFDDEQLKNFAYELSDIKLKFETQLTKANVRKISLPVGKINPDKTYRNYLLDEDIPYISKTNIDNDSFLKLYNQIADVFDKVNQLTFEALKELLFFQEKQFNEAISPKPIQIQEDDKAIQ